jgi:hypothetical protein
MASYRDMVTFFKHEQYTFQICVLCDFYVRSANVIGARISLRNKAIIIFWLILPDMRPQPPRLSALLGTKFLTERTRLNCKITQLMFREIISFNSEVHAKLCGQNAVVKC